MTMCFLNTTDGCSQPSVRKWTRVGTLQINNPNQVQKIGHTLKCQRARVRKQT